MLPPSFPVSRVPPRKMAAAVRGAEELELLERLLGLPAGNKYGVQGERKVKGARRSLERVAVVTRVGGWVPSDLLSPVTASLRASFPSPWQFPSDTDVNVARAPRIPAQPTSP